MLLCRIFFPIQILNKWQLLLLLTVINNSFIPGYKPDTGWATKSLWKQSMQDKYYRVCAHVTRNLDCDALVQSLKIIHEKTFQHSSGRIFQENERLDVMFLLGVKSTEKYLYPGSRYGPSWRTGSFGPNIHKECHCLRLYRYWCHQKYNQLYFVLFSGC